MDYGFLGSVLDHDLSMRVNMMKIKSYNYESILSLLVSQNNCIFHFYVMLPPDLPLSFARIVTLTTAVKLDS